MSDYEDRLPRLGGTRLLSDEEVFVIFDVVNEHGEPKKAREIIHETLHLPRPHRTTIARVFNVGVEFLKRDPNALELTTQEVEEIATKAGYNIPPSRVIALHRLFRLWKASKRGAELESGKYPTQEMEVTEMTSLSEKYLIDHYQKLHKVLEQFYDQLRIPELSKLCLSTPEGRIEVSHLYVSGIQWTAIIYEKGAVKLGVEVSDSFVWGCLNQHLVAEFTEFSKNFDDWKKGVAAIVEKCCSITQKITQQLEPQNWASAKPYLSRDSKDYAPGVYYDILVTSMYECVITGCVPKFVRISDDTSGLLLHIMEGPTGRKEIARGDTSLLKQVEKCCLGIESDNTIKEKAEHVLGLAKQVEVMLEPIKQNLRLVLERGTFKGTCSVCTDLVS